jgi:hypothetical protein
MLVVIAFLACNSNAESLQPSSSRQSWQDLEVITLDSQGKSAKTVYYSYDQLLALPTVTVKTERDPNTHTPATYSGVDSFRKRVIDPPSKSRASQGEKNAQKTVRNFPMDSAVLLRFFVHAERFW